MVSKKMSLPLSIFIVAVLLHSTAAGVLEKQSFGSFNVIPPRAGIANEQNGLEVEVAPANGPLTKGILGMSLPGGVGFWTECESDDPNALFCAQWGDFAKVLLKPRPGQEDRCMRIEWSSTYARELSDCYDLDPQVHWYGGGQTWLQTWPLDLRPTPESAYVSEGEFWSVVENYWLLSSGAGVVIDPDTPLYFSMNTTHPNRVCFTARDNTPYTKRSPLTLNYEWCTGRNIKEAHQFIRNNFFDLPTGIPDEEMLVKPLWSTWAEYKTSVNQTIVLDFAKRVISEGFINSSHIEIDDHWERCYGEEVFDPAKFPDAKAMVQEIKDMDLRLTMWVHPFVNYDCPLFQEGFDKGYFVKTPRGKTGITSWWQGSNSGIIDVTNPEAAQWWTDRLRKLQSDTGVDSFKFDAGETSLLPSAATFSGDSNLWPTLFSTKYVETAAQFGGLIETRIGRLNQKQPIFIRMSDKDSSWGYGNGLQAMIPSLLHFGIVGYPFVLPDMIGGNAYGDPPSKELYVRWMQVNIFMPSVQFSLVPWKYDTETVQICLDVLAQREKYAEHILEAARQATVDGSPVNRPMWWVDPEDVTTHTIDDAYMLGDRIMVAPVLVEGATSRDIYLPQGTWKDQNGQTYSGKQWLRNYPAPLNVVPFFTKEA